MTRSRDAPLLTLARAPARAAVGRIVARVDAAVLAEMLSIRADERAARSEGADLKVGAGMTARPAVGGINLQVEDRQTPPAAERAAVGTARAAVATGAVATVLRAAVLILDAVRVEEAAGAAFRVRLAHPDGGGEGTKRPADQGFEHAAARGAGADDAGETVEVTVIHALLL